MKKVILGTMLLGALAMQSASAAVRTFDFTATVTHSFDIVNPSATTVSGPLSGTTIDPGDQLTGRFSFDDMGHDWINAGGNVSNAPVLSFSYTLVKYNATVNVGDTLWHHDPHVSGRSAFHITDGNYAHTVGFTIDAPEYGFNWQLGNGTTAQFTSLWSASIHGLMYSQVTSLNEVSMFRSSLAEVSAVPEPATWGMLLVGAAVAGAAAKRRKASRSA